MADLDDFFAKKDKKKSKVKKFTASELLTSSKFHQGEDVAAVPTGVPRKPPVERPKKEEIVHESGDSEAAPVQSKPTVEAEEEEWGEFEQEKERDYSGLKIQKLQIQDSEDDFGDESGETELNEEGEVIKKEPAGPWNKINAQPTINVKVKEAVVEIPTPNTAGGVYIPPSKRNQPAGGSSSSSASASRSRIGKKEKGAPDLNNQEFFPTLSAAVAIEQNNLKLKKFEQTERGFTEAKPSRSHCNRNAVVPGHEGPHLHLGNKFNALSNDD